MNQVLHYTPPTVSGITSPATSFTYNVDHQLTKVTRPDGTLLSLAYNSTKERIDSITVARGKSTFYYNATSGLLDSLSAPDTISIRYTYDGDLPLSEQWAGRLPGISSLTVSRTFTPQFQESTQTVGSTSAVTFLHDLDGLLTNAGSLSIHRLTQNGLVDSTQAGIITSSQNYDALGELANLHYSSNGTAIFHQNVTRDALGRITEIVENAFGTSRTYGYRYDLAGRLYGVKLNADTIAIYGYDLDGNRSSFKNPLTGDTASATYDEQDRMLRYKDTRYTYTAAGEMASKTIGSSVTTYTYDALGALTKVVLPNGDVITYSMDGTSRRVGRRLNGAWTGGWVYDGPFSVVGELDASGGVLNRYIYGADGQTPALMVRGGTTYRVIVDQLGSVRGLVSTSDGTVLQQMDYDAWGVPTVVSGAGVQGLGYAGGLTDASTGLVQFGARDYESATGRWTAKDPAGMRSSTPDLYEYCISSPINYTDPTGLRPLTRCEKVVLEPYIPQIDLDAADIEEGMPWYAPLADGITIGNTIHVRPGVYKAKTAEDFALIGHELIHVGQYRRHELTRARYMAEAWVKLHGIGTRNKFEKAAIATQAEIARDLTKNGVCPCRDSQQEAQ